MDPMWQVGSGVEPGYARALAAGVPAVPEIRTVGKAAATAVATFQAIPNIGDGNNDGDTITVNTVTFSFVAANAVSPQVNVGATAALSATAFATAFNASVAANPSLAGISAAAVNGVVTLTHTSGGVGNTATIFADSQVITLTGVRNSPAGLTNTFEGGSSGELSPNVSDTNFVIGTTAQTFILQPGLEGQTRFLMATAMGAGGSAVVTLNANHTLTFSAALKWATIKFLGGVWTMIAGTAVFA